MQTLPTPRSCPVGFLPIPGPLTLLRLPCAVSFTEERPACRTLPQGAIHCPHLRSLQAQTRDPPCPRDPAPSRLAAKGSTVLVVPSRFLPPVSEHHLNGVTRRPLFCVCISPPLHPWGCVINPICCVWQGFFITVKLSTVSVLLRRRGGFYTAELYSSQSQRWGASGSGSFGTW